MIEYKRGIRDKTLTSERMTWTSRCGQSRVQECKNSYSNRTFYYALVLDKYGQFRMLEHMKTYRTRKAAEKAIEKFLRPKKVKKGRK